MARDMTGLLASLDLTNLHAINNDLLELIRLIMIERFLGADIDIENTPEDGVIAITDEVNYTPPDILKECVIGQYLLNVQPLLEEALEYILRLYVNHTVNDFSGTDSIDVWYDNQDDLITALNNLYYEGDEHWTEIIKMTVDDPAKTPHLYTYLDWTEQTLQILMMCRWRLGTIWDCRKKAPYVDYYRDLPDTNEEWMEVRQGYSLNNASDKCSSALINGLSGYYLDTWERQDRLGNLERLFPAVVTSRLASVDLVSVQNWRGKYTVWYPQSINKPDLGVEAKVDVYVRGEVFNDNYDYVNLYQDLYPVPIELGYYALYEADIDLTYEDTDNHSKLGDCILELQKAPCPELGIAYGLEANPYPIYKWEFQYKDYGDLEYDYYLGGNWNNEHPENIGNEIYGFGCNGSYSISGDFEEI